MTATQWALLSITLLAGAATPGASLALVISTATKYGRLPGLVQSLTHGIGIGFYALLVSTGISSLLFASTYAFQVLQFTGCMLLLYLGGKMFVGGWRSRHKQTIDIPLGNTTGTAKPSLLSHATKGFLIVFFNPKVALFFFAVFSQFLNPEQSLILQWSMASLAGVLDALWYSSMAILVSVPRVSKALNQFDWQLEILWGSVLVSIAAGLLLSLFTGLAASF
jgi:threonine/homoserine/homoserine lactone efflux protein